MESTNFFGVCILKIWHLYYKTKSQCYVCQPVVCCCMLFWHLRSQKYSSFQHRCLLFVQTSTTYYSTPSVYAVAVANQKSRKSKFALYKSQYGQNNCQKKVQKISIKLYYKSLCKFFWTRSKNRVIENRVMENRVKRGITVVGFSLSTIFAQRDFCCAQFSFYQTRSMFFCTYRQMALKAAFRYFHAEMSVVV